MSKLLVALPCCADDAVLAERLIDWIAFLNGKIPKGRLLLAYSADLHQEMRVRLKISAEIAFESVAEMSLARQGDTRNKIEQINSVFRQVAAHVQSHCRWPWLFLEPDCVVLKHDWLERLLNAYDMQEKRFCGRGMGTPDKGVFMARVGIYNSAAYSELDKFCGDPNVGFQIVSADYISTRFSKCPLFQELSITDDASMQRIRPDAVLLHGDKWGKVIAKLRTELPPAAKNGEHIAWHPKAIEIIVPPESPVEMPRFDTQPKIDLRTKAGRALKAQIDAAKKSTPLQTT